MDKKYLIAGAIVVLLVGIAFTVLNKNDSPGIIKNTITNRLSAKDGVKCIQKVSVGENGNSLTTTLYFYKNNMRYDSEMSEEVQGQKDMHAISDGEYTYIWGNSTPASMFGGSNTGFKIKKDEDDGNYAPDFDVEELEKSEFNAPNLNCEKWTPDNKMFELPKNIEFKTLEEAMAPPITDSSTQSGSETPEISNMCAMCDTIPDATAKAECKKSCSESQ